MPKAKHKRKPRQWKLKGWVAVLTSDMTDRLCSCDIAWACTKGLSGRTKSELLDEMNCRHLDLSYYTLVDLDIIATVK